MKTINYYVTGHTAKGKVNYIQSNIKDINDIITLHHPSNRLKTAILQTTLKQYNGNELELILHPLSKDYLAGFICREKSSAILIDELGIDAGRKIDLTEYVVVDETEAEMYENQIEHVLNSAYQAFERGLKIHDDLEAVFLKEMNFHKADDLAYDLIDGLFKDIQKKNKQSKFVKRLFGTNTPEGMTNQLAVLTEQVGKRYFIKGRAGTGKSHLMKQVLAKCEAYGLDVEIYHCSFDPDSIDMLIIRELDCCLFDSTDPHALDPNRDDDEVIDMYEKTVRHGTDEKYETEIERITKQYKGEMKKGLNILSEIKSIDQKKEAMITEEVIQTMSAHFQDILNI
ncbi:MAG TPA: hypothetical protein VK067_02405 [Pseudogracilibacillus sp.]|nr:hypothetical protein [Pseudogracilibacillus sp.]